MGGFNVVEIPSNEKGTVDLDAHTVITLINQYVQKKEATKERPFLQTFSMILLFVIRYLVFLKRELIWRSAPKRNSGMAVAP